MFLKTECVQLVKAVSTEHVSLVDYQLKMLSANVYTYVVYTLYMEQK